MLIICIPLGEVRHKIKDDIGAVWPSLSTILLPSASLVKLSVI